MGLYKNGVKLGMPYLNGKKMSCYYNGKKLFSGGHYDEFIPEELGTHDLIYAGLDINDSVTEVEADIVAYRLIGWENPRNIDYLRVPSEKNGKPVTELYRLFNDGFSGGIIIDNFLIGSNMLRIFTRCISGDSYPLYDINYMYLPTTVEIINYDQRDTYTAELRYVKKLYYNCTDAISYTDRTSKNNQHSAWGFLASVNTEIIIGRDVEIVGSNTFWNEPIAKLTFDPKTKCHTLKSYCFSVTLIEEVDIPKSVVNIEEYVFKGSRVRKITVRGNATLNDNCFAKHDLAMWGLAYENYTYLLQVNLLGDYIIATPNIFGDEEHGKQPHVYFIRNLSSTPVGYDLEFQEEIFDATTPFANTFENIDDKYWILNTAVDGHRNLIRIRTDLNYKDADLSDSDVTRVLPETYDLGFLNYLILPSTLEIIKERALSGGDYITIGSAAKGSNLQNVEINGIHGKTKYSLILYGAIPPNVVAGSFIDTLNLYPPSRIKVPSASVDAYKNHPDWIESGYADLVEAIEEQ